MRLLPGNLLVGVHDLRLEKRLGSGGSGVTYLARVKRPARGSALVRNRLVVIKTPHIKSSLTNDEIRERLTNLFEKGLIEAGTEQFLKGLKCVAHVLDHSDYKKMLKNRRRSSKSVLAVVQEYVPGRRLDEYMLRTFGKPRTGFRGIPTAEDYFSWAWKIVSAVRQVHQRQVVHGDIWHNNIIVRAGTTAPILIDFGQAAFFAKGSGFGGRNQGSWMPPEGSGTISADMYSLGGLLLYLATGDYDEMADRFPRIEDIERLKTYVVRRIRRLNPVLYNENAGVADIVARCLRKDPERRTRNTAALLQDISLFHRTAPVVLPAQSLIANIRGLQQKGTLIAALMSGAISNLRDQLADLRYGVLDLHEDVVVGMTQVVSLLSKDDEYLTVTTPRFWQPNNLGIQGRFLSANRQAVLRNGAVIKRLFLITRSDLVDDNQLDSIITAQLSIARDLAVAYAAGSKRCGKYEVRFKPVTDSERRRLIREGMNFGVLIKGSNRLLLSIGYADDGVIGRIQFRTDATLTRSYAARFAELFADESTFPLTSFSDWKVQHLADPQARRKTSLRGPRRVD